FVGRLSTAGAWQWVVRGGAESYEEPGGIAVDGAGAAYVAGAYGDPYGLYAQETRFGSTVLPRLGYSDVFVAKLNAAGAWQWAVQGGTDTTDSRGYWGASYGRDIALDAGGGAAYVVGGFTGEIARFGPSVLVNSTPGVGNYLNVYQQQDLFVAKLATGNGVWQWARGAGAGGVPFYGNGDGDGGPVALDVASAVAVDGSGRVVVAGYSASPTYRAVFGGDTLRGNTFVARLTPGGAWEWVVGAATGMAEAYANSDRSFAYYDPYLPLPCLTLDPAGNAYVGGAMERKLVVPFGPVDVDGPGHGLTAFVAKVNPAAPARPGVPGSIVEVAGRLELVPNPAHGIVRLEGQRELLQVGGVVTVLNHQGEQVLRQEVRGGGEASLDIRGLSAGLYLVRVQAVGQEKAAVGRLVVE
ncbi:MAG TPA: T9SS type A sorting domain-containing protein, partial [bacterium]|nr:T9SS type A sorting domain-containing protein [bacterium]